MQEIAKFLVTVINGVGTAVFLGLVGCYLIIIAIVNRFVPRRIQLAPSGSGLS